MVFVVAELRKLQKKPEKQLHCSRVVLNTKIAQLTQLCPLWNAVLPRRSYENCNFWLRRDAQLWKEAK